MATYTTTRVKDNLYFVRLHSYPTPQDCYLFLQEMKSAIENASGKVYFVIDFRQGMFTEIGMLRQAAKLTTHPNFGASIGFGGNAIKRMYGDIFAEGAQQPDEVPADMPDTIEEAIAMLEGVAPGITEGIDWAGHFAD
jgi:hypothetical protein